MDLKNTVNLMLSDDYKKRFKAEYLQLKERFERLRIFNNKIRAAHYSPDKLEMPKHDCPDGLLEKQEHIMADYLKVLEVRAVIEGVSLDEQ